MKGPHLLNRFFSIALISLLLAAAAGAAGESYDLLKKRGSAGLEKLIVSLARVSLTTYLKTGKRPLITIKVPPELEKPGGAFVTLVRNGKTVGCMGTLNPTQPSLAQEIMRSAILAATQDTRHRSVRLKDLDGLRFIVSVPGKLTRVTSAAQLQPEKLGLLVRRGSRSALLLPGEARTAVYQLEECRRKAGIPKSGDVEMFTFPTLTFGPG